MGDPTRKTTFGDVLSGYFTSFREGTFRNPFAVKRNINDARNERIGQMVITIATGKAVDQFLREINTQVGHDRLYTSADVKIEARRGWSNDLSVPTLDVKVYNRHSTEGQHLHAVYNLTTEELIFAHLKRNKRS